MNPRNQVEIKIHKNDYLTISFIGDINFAGRWYGTPETLREKLRSFPHKSERDKVLDRLDKEIHIREDEMNRKAGLEENLVTMSGYYASAGALNWVRKVLIDGSRETIRQAGEPDA